MTQSLLLERRVESVHSQPTLAHPQITDSRRMKSISIFNPLRFRDGLLFLHILSCRIYSSLPEWCAKKIFKMHLSFCEEIGALPVFGDHSKSIIYLNAGVNYWKLSWAVSLRVYLRRSRVENLGASSWVISGLGKWRAMLWRTTEQMGVCVLWEGSFLSSFPQQLELL